MSWCLSRKVILNKEEVLIESVNTQMDGPKAIMIGDIIIPPRTFAVINIHIHLESTHDGFIYDVQSCQSHINEHPNMALILQFLVYSSIYLLKIYI